MTLGDIYSFLNLMLDKHSSGNKFTPSEFNYMIKSEILNFVDDQVEEIQKAARSIDDYMELMQSSKALKQLVTSETAALSGGTYALSGLASTFGYFGGIVTQAAFHGKIAKVEHVNSAEFIDRQTNLLKPNIYYNPICTLVGASLHFLPQTIDNVTFYYVKLPTTPFFDYYIDQYRNIVFLAEGGSVNLDVITGTYRDGSTSGTQNSITNELDLDQQAYPKFTEYLLSRLGVKSENALLLQHAENEQAKDKQI